MLARLLWWPMALWLVSGGLDPAIAGWDEPCGPVALKVFTSLKGQYHTIGQLARLTNTNSAGTTSLLEMKKALSALGLDAAICEVTFEQLQDLPLPVILLTKPSTTPHYVVLARRKSDGQKVIVDLPHPEARFDRAALRKLGWQGIALFSRRPGMKILETHPEAVDLAPLLCTSKAYLDASPSNIVRVPMRNQTRRAVRIVNVRASCSTCLDSQNPFSYPAALQPGVSGTLLVRLDSHRKHSFSWTRVFVATDNPARPLEFCDVIRLEAFVRVFPTVVRLGPIEPNDDPAICIRTAITSFAAIDTAELKMALESPEATPPEPLAFEVTDQGRQEGGRYYAVCAVDIPRQSLFVRRLESQPVIPGHRDSRAARLSVYDAERLLGRIKVRYEARTPLKVSPCHLFFGRLSVAVGPTEKRFWVSTASPDCRLLSGEVGLENSLRFLNARSESTEEGRWQVTVSADPTQAVASGFYSDAVVLPYLLNRERRTIRVPLHLSVVN